MNITKEWIWMLVRLAIAGAGLWWLLDVAGASLSNEAAMRTFTISITVYAFWQLFLTMDLTWEARQARVLLSEIRDELRKR